MRSFGCFCLLLYKRRDVLLTEKKAAVGRQQLRVGCGLTALVATSCMRFYCIHGKNLPFKRYLLHGLALTTTIPVSLSRLSKHSSFWPECTHG
jgi:hypothetical protein